MTKTRKRRYVHRRRTKKHRRHTKRRVKRRRKTTRKKRGRGISPSRMAKGAVVAAVASEVMKQGSAVVSPQARAVQQQLRSSNCNMIKERGRQLIKPFHPDHGGTNEDFRDVHGTWKKRRSQCKLDRQRGDTEQDSKPKPKRRPGESAKKARQRANRARRAKAEAARKAKQQEEQAKAKARAQAKARAKAQEEADARAGRQESQRGSTKPTVAGELAKAGAMGAAAAVGLGAAHQLLGKKEERRTSTHRFDFGDGRGIRRFEGPFTRRGRSMRRVADGSYWRERTPERQGKPVTGPVHSNFLGKVAYHT